MSLLEQLDEQAKQDLLSRSAAIRQAVLAWLHNHPMPAVKAQTTAPGALQNVRLDMRGMAFNRVQELCPDEDPLELLLEYERQNRASEV
jgi:hypothetical protein